MSGDRPDIATALGLLLVAVLEAVAGLVDKATYRAGRIGSQPVESPYVTRFHWPDEDGSYPTLPAEPAPLVGVAPTDYTDVPCPVVGCCEQMNHWGDHLDSAGELIALMIEIPSTDFREGRRQRATGNLGPEACLAECAGAPEHVCDLDADHPGDHESPEGGHWRNRTPTEVRRRLHEAITPPLSSLLPSPSEVGHGRPTVIEGPENDHGRPPVYLGEPADATYAPEHAGVIEVYRQDNAGRDCPVCGRRRHTGDQAAECAEALS